MKRIGMGMGMGMGIGIAVLGLAAATASPTASPPPSLPAPAAVTSAGTVIGTVTYAGPETDGVVNVTQDLAACGAQGAQRPERSLIVTGGRLASVLVRIDGVAGAPAPVPATVTLENIGCAFEPRVMVAPLTGKLAIGNRDPVLHGTNLATMPDARPIANVALPTQGQVIEKTLRKPGLVGVTCDVHPWMKAWIFVAPHPFTAVTGQDGTFRLTGVPAGTWTVTFWHERLGERSLQVTVPLSKNGDGHGNGEGAAVADMAF